jgi:nucleotide-binding universal stress UspA family protein
MYKNIIVCFDGSLYSKSALSEVASWINKHGGNAVLVHAAFFEEEEFGIIPDQIEQRMRLGSELCRKAVEEISSTLGIKIGSIVCEGDPPDAIAKIARKEKADLIAIGTHGRRGIKKLLMGSVTSGVIANAPCDVLVVKKSYPEFGGAFKQILVPFDGSEYSKKALVRACEMAELDGGEVTVVYVIARYEEMAGFFMTDTIKDALMKEAEKITGAAANLALEKGIKIKTLIVDGDTGGRISEVADTGINDLIIIGSHGWSGVTRAVMGSTTERVIMYANTPVLVVT